jgi:hypothetical protein
MSMRKNRVIYFPLILPILALLFWSIFFFEGETKYNKTISELNNKKIGGIVLKSNELNRGFHLIEISDKISNCKLIYNLPKSWFFKENNILIGDSVSKEAKSETMTFYKKSKGRFQKCCEYEIGM